MDLRYRLLTRCRLLKLQGADEYTEQTDAGKGKKANHQRWNVRSKFQVRVRGKKGMGDQLVRADEFDKKLNGWGIFGSKYEDAADLLEKLLILISLPKSWDQAEKAFLKLAVCHLKPDSIYVMGDKSIDRETMKNAGVPTVPESDGLLQSTEEGVRPANEIGFPVMIKLNYFVSMVPRSSNSGQQLVVVDVECGLLMKRRSL